MMSCPYLVRGTSMNSWYIMEFVVFIEFVMLSCPNELTYWKYLYIAFFCWVGSWCSWHYNTLQHTGVRDTATHCNNDLILPSFVELAHGVRGISLDSWCFIESTQWVDTLNWKRLYIPDFGENLLPGEVSVFDQVKLFKITSVLQCIAVCCSVLQCVAVCCSVLQWLAVCYSVLQFVAVWYSVW